MAPAKQKKRGKRSLSDLKYLGNQLLTSRAHINNLPLLLTYINPSTPSPYVLESLLSLQSFFVTVLPELPPSSSSRASLSSAEADPEIVYRTWLRLKFDEFINSLIEIAISTGSDETMREVVLDTFMEFVKLGHGGSFHSAIYHKLLHNIVCSDLGVEYLLESLASKYFKYIDVRYFTYISMEKLAKILETRNNSASGDACDKIHPEARFGNSINKIYFIMSHIPPFGSPENTDEEENWSESGIKQGTTNHKAVMDKNKQLQVEKSNKNGFPSSSKRRLKLTKAWMSFLRLPLPLDVYKEVLVNLHQTVIPYLSNPVMLCDFLTRSYDIGGVISVMALSSLYILMTKHGLEYPNFYEKLYALLVPSVFMAKHRAKFFEFLDLCLKSPLLPAYLAAAFAKKLSRLALAIPPYGGLNITALVDNILLRHPSINCLIHQDGNANSQEDMSAVESENNVGSSVDICTDKQGVDLFKDDESDPLKSNALRSSLWELDTLRHHYCPPISRFVETLKEDLTNKRKTSEINIKDFSSASYSTIFREEMRRRVKKVPLEFYTKIPSSLFSETDFPQWSFKFEGRDQGNAIDDQNSLPAAPADCSGNSVKRQRAEVY